MQPSAHCAAAPCFERALLACPTREETFTPGMPGAVVTADGSARLCSVPQLRESRKQRHSAMLCETPIVARGTI